MILSDETILNLFGADDAENESPDRLKEYFYENKQYQAINSSLPIRVVVGHKGVGKSALLKRAHLNDLDVGNSSVWLQADSITDVQDEASKEANFVKRISVWRQGILRETLKVYYGEEAEKMVPELRTASYQALAKVLVKYLDELKANSAINVYIDDIDRGWKAHDNDIVNISALLNAIRDISGSHPRIKFRIGLRSDVYFLVRTSDESTDKIEANVVWLRWTNDDILRVLAKRISTYYGLGIPDTQISQLEQSAITSRILSKVMDPTFKGRGKWESRPMHKILLSMTRARPRDLVKLLRLAAQAAHSRERSIISSIDLNDVFENYSQERLQDIINEFASEVPNVERLLLSMKPAKKERLASNSYLFSTAALTTKISRILGNTPVSFTNKKSVTARAIIQFLYKIDFITARKVQEDGLVDRKYFDQSRFLAHEIVEFGYDWEIHPAYRWALQPQDVNEILNTLDV
ncbi:P-loop ATPase, Sll1717 family [Brucella pseudogrignonensis]|uniref:P-loop ATPase, Sll1717 family n=1 Tax=Brucella pseudogrignonensis TaxID=419475 RepID=UPI0038D080C4